MNLRLVRWKQGTVITRSNSIHKLTIANLRLLQTATATTTTLTTTPSQLLKRKRQFADDDDDDDSLTTSNTNNNNECFHRYLCVLEYEGSVFQGFSHSPSSSPYSTVEGVVLTALNRIWMKSTESHEAVKLVVAGRTDAGVHALGQVCHFDLPTSLQLSSSSIQHLLNRSFFHQRLNSAIHCIHVRKVKLTFHARFSAIQRVYLYRVINGERMLFQDKQAWWIQEFPLNLELMRNAAQLFIGTFDFKSLAAKQRTKSHKPTIRQIQQIQIETQPSSGSSVSSSPTSFQQEQPTFSSFYTDHTSIIQRCSVLYHFTFVAPSFLHHQIRNLMQLLIEVGLGNLSLTDVPLFLQGKPRHQNPLSSAPPHGLFLKEVKYNQQQLQQDTIEELEEDSDNRKLQHIKSVLPRWEAISNNCIASSQIISPRRTKKRKAQSDTPN